MMVRLSMALTLTVIGGLVHVLSRAREGRLFLMPLGRPTNERDHARTRRVQLVNAASVLSAIAVLFATEVEAALLAAVLVATLVPVLVMLVELRRATAERGLEKVPGRFVVPLGDRGPKLRELVSWPLETLNLALIVAGVLAFLAIAPNLPAEVPMHWNVAGKVDRVGHPRELWILFATALFDTALLLGIAWAVARERWVLPAANADRYAALAFERRRLTVRLTELVIIVVNASMMLTWIMIALGAGMDAKDLGGLVALVVAPLSTLGVMIAVAVFVPKMMTIADELRALGGDAALGTRPGGWRFGGLVYFAPEDPAVLVPKRSGLGQTLNFARPSAWMLLGATVLLPLGIVAVLAVTRTP